MSEINAATFMRLVVNLMRDEPDDRIISLGTLEPSPVNGRPPLFYATMRVTVGDFRRWEKETGNEPD